MKRAILLLFAAIPLCAPGCAVAEISDYPCPEAGTTLTYEGFGKTFFAVWCDRCHSAPAGDRDGAPQEYSFGTLAEIRAHKDRIFARSAGPNDSMPIGPNDPPREDRDKLAEWLSCGAP